MSLLFMQLYETILDRFTLLGNLSATLKYIPRGARKIHFTNEKKTAEELD
jgi:hypothetical protein